MNAGGAVTTAHCPSCNRPLERQTPAACPSCGLPLDGPLGQRLLEVHARIAELEVERRQLLALQRLRAPTAPVRAATVPAGPPPQGPDAGFAALRAAGPQTLLAAGGVLLLAIAAVVFTAVAWRDLSALVRGGLIAVAALGCAVATRRLVARALQRTAEATAVLTVVLLGVLLNGLWRAGVFRLFADGRDIVAAGAAALAAVAHLLASWTRTRAPQVLTAWLAPIALVAAGPRLVDALGADGARPGELLVLGGAFLVAATVAAVYADHVLIGLPRWRTATQVAGAVLWCAAAVLAFGAGAEADAAWTPAAGALVAAVTAAAVTARRLATRGRPWWDPVGAAGAWLAATCGLASVLDVPWASWADLTGLIPAAAGAAALWLLRGPRARTGAVAGMVPVLLLSLVPFARSAAWLATVGTGRVTVPWAASGVSPGGPPVPDLPTLVQSAAVVGVVAAVAVALRWVAPALRWVAGAGCAVVSMSAAVVVWPAGGGVTVAILAAGGAALALRRGYAGRVALVALAAATVVGVVFGLSGRTATIAALALAAVAAGAALRGGGAGRLADVDVMGRPATAVLAGLLTADVLGLAAAVAAAATAAPGPVGVAVTVAAAAGWVAAGRARGAGEVVVTVDVVAAVGFAAGITLAAGAARLVWLAVAFGVLAVAATAVTILRADRSWMRWIATGAGSASSWTVLSMLDVGVVEAYSAPPALVMLALGAVALRARPGESSWRALGAGLGLLVTPTVLQIVDDPDDLARVAAAIALGSALAVAGRVRALQAPLVSGVAALAVVALTQHDVVTDVVPRWLLLAAGGTLLLWLSMSYERQLRRVAALRRGLAALR